MFLLVIASITMAKGTTFNTTIGQINYNYITNEDITITPAGVYKFSNVTLYEGTVSFQYTVDSTDVDQKFIIQSQRQIHLH